jgi:hypothetical protein
MRGVYERSVCEECMRGVYVYELSHTLACTLSYSFMRRCSLRASRRVVSTRRSRSMNLSYMNLCPPPGGQIGCVKGREGTEGRKGREGSIVHR